MRLLYAAEDVPLDATGVALMTPINLNGQSNADPELNYVPVVLVTDVIIRHRAGSNTGNCTFDLSWANGGQFILQNQSLDADTFHLGSRVEYKTENMEGLNDVIQTPESTGDSPEDPVLFEVTGAGFAGLRGDVFVYGVHLFNERPTV